MSPLPGAVRITIPAPFAFKCSPRPFSSPNSRIINYDCVINSVSSIINSAGPDADIIFTVCPLMLMRYSQHPYNTPPKFAVTESLRNRLAALEGRCGTLAGTILSNAVVPTSRMVHKNTGRQTSNRQNHTRLHRR